MIRYLACTVVWNVAHSDTSFCQCDSVEAVIAHAHPDDDLRGVKGQLMGSKDTFII